MRFSALPVAVSLIAINYLGYFVFPGHSYLGSDTQIYLPMLERIWDPTLLAKDLVAVNPHVSFTIYDELAVFSRTVTGLSFDRVLPILHFLFRLAGIYGIFLIFQAWAFSTSASWCAGSYDSAKCRSSCAGAARRTTSRTAGAQTSRQATKWPTGVSMPAVRRQRPAAAARP